MKQKQKECPICGSSIRKGREYALQDAEICDTCADRLRFEYPVEYLPVDGRKVPDISKLATCRNLKKKDLKTVRDYMQGTTLFTSGERKIVAYRIDAMHALTLEVFQKKLAGADAAEEKIRSNYDGHTNVCSVEFARPLDRPFGKGGILNFRKRRKGFAMAGRVLCGTFCEGDSVKILHEGDLRDAEILAVDYEECTVGADGNDMRTGGAENLGERGASGNRVRAGYQVCIVLNDQAEGIVPGDLLIHD